jgi:hypothetical protein
VFGTTVGNGVLVGVSVKDPDAGALDLTKGAGVLDEERLPEGTNTVQQGSRDWEPVLDIVGGAVREPVPD